MSKPMSRKGSTNVYKDLGFRNAEEMQAKAKLASRVLFIINKRKLTQKNAAKILGITQPKISLLSRGQFSGFSIAKLIKFLNKLNQDVCILVKDKSLSKHHGHMNVEYVSG